MTLIVQISDLHIKAPGRLAYGRVDTAEALRRAVEAINALDPQPAVVVISGDLVDRGGVEEYEHLCGLLAAIRVPIRVVPGNHDMRGPLRAILGDFCDLVAGAGPVNWVMDFDWARIIGLDTSVPGAGHGHLSTASLAVLARALDDRPDIPTMIVLHHPPVRLGIPGMDADNLRNANALGQILQPHAGRLALVCGHLHRAASTVFAGSSVIIAPGTSHAVLRAAEPPVRFAMEPPGYVLHSIMDGAWLAEFCPIGTFDGPYPFRGDDGKFLD